MTNNLKFQTICTTVEKVFVSCLSKDSTIDSPRRREQQNDLIQSFSAFQSQLSHGFPYSDRRGDYGGNIPGATGPGTRLTHDHDPLSLHQALQSAVDDGQGAVIDENVAFMSDLPLLKSE